MRCLRAATTRTLTLFIARRLLFRFSEFLVMLSISGTRCGRVGFLLADLRAEATVIDDGWHRWPEPHLNAAMTLEEAELLHQLVLATRPGLVLELGSGYGISGSFIAEALLKNGGGLLATVEPLAGLRAEAGIALARFGSVVDVLESQDELFGAPDLVFIDSGKPYRDADISFWMRAMTPALIVVHDAFRDYEGLRGAAGAIVPTAGGMWIGHA